MIFRTISIEKITVRNISNTLKDIIRGDLGSLKGLSAAN